MGYYCTVPQCTSLAGKTKNVKFHRFPRDVTMADKWNLILKRGKPYTKYSKVCSLHFTQADYNVTTMGQWKTLSRDAVPSQNLPKLNPDGSVMVIRKSRTVKYRDGKKEDSDKTDKSWQSALAGHSAHPLLTNAPDLPMGGQDLHDNSILAYRLQTLGAIANNISPQQPLSHNGIKPKKQDAFMQTDPVQNEDDDTQPNNSYSEVSEKSYSSEVEQYNQSYPKDSYPKESSPYKDASQYPRESTPYSKEYAKDTTPYPREPTAYKDTTYAREYKDSTYPKDSYAKDSFQKDSYTKESYQKDSYAKESYQKDSYAKESYQKDSYAKESFQKDSYAKDSFQKDSYAKEDTSYKDAYNSKNYEPKDYTKSSEDYIPQTNEEYNKEAEKYALERKSHNGYDLKEYQKQVLENGYQKLPIPDMYSFDKYNRDSYYQNGYADPVEVLQEQHRINENQNFFNENHIKQEIDINVDDDKFLYERSKEQLESNPMYVERRLQQQRILEHIQQQVKQEPDTPNGCGAEVQPAGAGYCGGGAGAGYYPLPRPGPELLIAKQNALAAHTQLWQNTMKRPFFYSESPHYNGPQLLHRYDDIPRILQ